ncbi:MAG: hypothetical protein Q4C68_03630 [Moraxella sp.]|nr:hypothetical protein [Moraxella sp.]
MSTLTAFKFCLCLLWGVSSVGFVVSASANAPAHNPNVTTENVMPHPSKVNEFNQDFQQLLHSESYSITSERSEWVQPTSPSTNAQTNSWWMDWFLRLYTYLSKVSPILGVVLKVVLLLLLLAVILWMMKYRHYVIEMVSRLQAKKSTPMPVFINSTTPTFAKLPSHESLAGVIEALLDKGAYLQALSLLYQGSLRAMKVQHHLPINQSETEAQCQWLLKNAKHHTKAELAFFDALVQLWQQAAYGKRLPSHNIKAELKQLLERWCQLYPSLPQGERHD